MHHFHSFSILFAVGPFLFDSFFFLFLLFFLSDHLSILHLYPSLSIGKFRHLPVVENGEVIALLDITKCLYDAISRMEKAAEQGSAIAAAVEGVERQWGSDFSGMLWLLYVLLWVVLWCIFLRFHFFIFLRDWCYGGGCNQIKVISVFELEIAMSCMLSE